MWRSKTQADRADAAYFFGFFFGGALLLSLDAELFLLDALRRRGLKLCCLGVGSRSRSPLRSTRNHVQGRWLQVLHNGVPLRDPLPVLEAS